MLPEAVRRWQQECERAGADCAARVEAVALRLPWARALRQGGSLMIFTLDGEVELRDEPGRDGSSYRYLGLITPGLLHLIWHRTGKRGTIFTISDHDGRRYPPPTTLLSVLRCQEKEQDAVASVR